MPKNSQVVTPSPSVLRFDVALAGRATGTGASIAIPSRIVRLIETLETIEGTINGHPFRAPLDRSDDDGRSLRVNAAMLRGASARAGDTVTLAILGPEPPLVLAADLRTAMKRSGEATALWADMSDIARRDYVRWIDATDNPTTRARRVERTVEQLAQGKRRPCCFNAYEYSLSYIDPQWLQKFRGKKSAAIES